MTGPASAERSPCRPPAMTHPSREVLQVGTFTEIGECVMRATMLLKLHGWHRTCHLLRGDRSDIHHDMKNLRHQAAPIMERIQVPSFWTF
jgi:hypothetical protein